jgi:hypothetical protein
MVPGGSPITLGDLMKISFDTTLTGKDQTGAVVTLSAADVAALVYTAFIDTVNPPVKSYPIPAAFIIGTVNANGSVHVTVDAASLGVVVQDNVPYFIALQDSLGTNVSAETSILTFTQVITPDPPSNPSVG